MENLTSKIAVFVNLDYWAGVHEIPSAIVSDISPDG